MHQKPLNTKENAFRQEIFNMLTTEGKINKAIIENMMGWPRLNFPEGSPIQLDPLSLSLIPSSTFLFEPQSLGLKIKMHAGSTKKSASRALIRVIAVKYPNIAIGGKDESVKTIKPETRIIVV